MSIPAVKGVEIGLGFEAAARLGSRVHDDVRWRRRAGRHGGIGRGSNRAGGLEGGITNGERLVVRAAMKPISTLRKPLRSVDLRRKTTAEAAFERSDVCAVAAASVVGEAMVLLAVGREYLAKFGGDSLRSSTPIAGPSSRRSGADSDGEVAGRPPGSFVDIARWSATLPRFAQRLELGCSDPREFVGRTSGESDPGANSLLA